MAKQAQAQAAHVQQTIALRNLYANSAQKLFNSPFGQIPYAQNGQGSIKIPNGFLLNGFWAHFHIPVTLNLNAGAAPALSPIAQLAIAEELGFNYNGSESNLFSADSIFVDQLMRMENPYGEPDNVNVVPVPAGAGTAYTYDWYQWIPATYSEASEMGVLNQNSDKINAVARVRWGNVANIFSLAAGQTATVNGGYVEFLTEKVTQPRNVALDGIPDLSKNYFVSYQDYNLAASGWNKLDIKADHTITRITVNLLDGTTVNSSGSDVAGYDSSNALNLQTVRLGWAEMVKKYDDVPYWLFQTLAAKNYGVNFKKYINKGTIVIDLDRFGGRDWIEAFNVTQLNMSLFLGSAPPAGSKARVYLEQIVNSDVTPIRDIDAMRQAQV